MTFMVTVTAVNDVTNVAIVITVRAATVVTSMISVTFMMVIML